ncbi:MAG TPA: TIGR00341 family protein [Chloroflexota bacterium]|nr:TIGR00341 family protein [Chloroflexota bacterium]
MIITQGYGRQTIVVVFWLRACFNLFYTWVHMEIIEGQIPKETAWRGLFLLADAEQLGKSWQLGLALARAHNGYLLTAVFLTRPTPDQIDMARQLLATARQSAPPDLADHMCPLIISSPKLETDLNKLIEQADIDLLFVHVDGPVRYNLNHVDCAVAAVRGDRVERAEAKSDTEAEKLQHILIPTSAGPNTAFAIQFLLRVTPRIKITALYVARSYLGSNEEALGRSRLRQLLQFVDAGDRLESQVIMADNVADGIVAATEECDLVIIGATRESSIDKVLFGDIPAAVVRQSKRPVMIVRQARNHFNNWDARLLWQLKKLLPHMELSKRTEAYTRIRRGARPDIDFYMLISLSAIIAAFGLMSNSGAVVIGAMLVAPLMSPIVGMGMAVVLGDARFLRLTTGAVLKGALLAIFVGMLAGLLLRMMHMDLSSEILARTRPSLLDLGIALFSGLAAAYALSRSDAAGALPGVAIAAALVPPLATVGITFAAGYFWESLGALLLFATNLVSISSATALMFLVLGFRPARNQKARRAVQMRSVQVELLSLAIIIFLLSVFTFELAQVQSQEIRIEEVTAAAVKDKAIIGGSLVELNYSFVRDENGLELLQMDVVVRSKDEVTYDQVEQLQQEIGTTLQNEGIAGKIALTMSVIQVVELAPLIPPTATPSPQ